MATPFTPTTTSPTSSSTAPQTSLPVVTRLAFPKSLGTRLGIPIRSQTSGTPSTTATRTTSRSFEAPSTTTDTSTTDTSTIDTSTTDTPTTDKTDLKSTSIVMAGHLPAVTEVDSSSLHSSKVETETSEYARTAMIISAVTLLLVLLVITAVALLFCRRRAKRKASRKEADLLGSTVVQGESGNNNRQGDEESYAGTSGGGGRLQFNSLNMVVSPVRLIPSMIESQMGSVTTITNPPPPYRNQSRSDLASPRSPRGRESSLGLSPAAIGGGEVLLRVPENGVGGNQAAYSLETVSRLLPASLTVRYAFNPTSADELRVSKGDKLQVTGVFDDGWCLCRTEIGKKGVVPLASLDLPSSGSPEDQAPVEGEPENGADLGRLARTESRNLLINTVVPEEGVEEPASQAESPDAGVPPVVGS